VSGPVTISWWYPWQELRRFVHLNPLVPIGEKQVRKSENPPKDKADKKQSVSGLLSRPAGWALCLSFLLSIAIVRIVSTYDVFNHTIDEPSHIAGGIEWWEKGVYRIETKHTPLARISVALGPYLAGVRGTGATNWRETFPILSANGHYWRNLTLGRIGVLPYFVVATVVVFFWTKRLFGAPTGLLAAALFTQLPTILAHSGLATTDIALTAMFCWALYAFTVWLREPNLRTAAQFGVAAGLSICAKLSSLVFFPACAAPILAMYAARGPRPWRALLRTSAVAVFCGFMVLWAVYRFSYAPLNQVTRGPERAAARIFGPSSGMTGIIHQISTRVPVPAPELLDGLRFIRNQNNEGSKAYLFGRLKEGGWWYFFFVALALKTPLAVLALGAAGSVIVVLRFVRDRGDWESAAPLAASAMMMIVTTSSRLDSGVRYVMPMFVFISILAALGLATIWERRDHRLIFRAVAILLFAWLTISSARSHPDYLSYFNELGGRDPSRLIVVGDFDWGQDMTRLAAYLRERQVKHISISYDGFYDPEPLGLPETQELKCDTDVSGLVAIEMRCARLYPECYPWLSRGHLVTTVGKTMLVYNVPEKGK
jgi:hypothetical protein